MGFLKPESVVQKFRRKKLAGQERPEGRLLKNLEANRKAIPLQSLRIVISDYILFLSEILIGQFGL